MKSVKVHGGRDVLTLHGNKAKAIDEGIGIFGIAGGRVRARKTLGQWRETPKAIALVGVHAGNKGIRE
jgi:hypothetical protein